MLYEINEVDKELKEVKFKNLKDLGEKEKDLENLLIENLNIIFTEKAQLIAIFREREWKEEPDICALDKEGNLIIFELKREKATSDAISQIIRYTQKFGRYNYNLLNENYKKFCKKEKIEEKELLEVHKESFGLDIALPKEKFNQKQKMYIIGSSSDLEFIEVIDYWKNKGLNIDFIPYRIYEFEKKKYLEFFAKPYDYSFSNAKKGVIFDTNTTYDPEAVLDMLENKKISAYGKAKKFVNRFNKGDYVFYYQKGMGIIAVGKIKSKVIKENEDKDEAFHTVEIISPKDNNITDITALKSISASELKEICNKEFYFASTVKFPYLSEEEAKILMEKLQEKYNEK